MRKLLLGIIISGISTLSCQEGAIIAYSKKASQLKVSLIGPELIGKKIEHILADHYSALVSDIPLHKNSLIAYDTSRSVYQLYMLQQPLGTDFSCAFHALRNTFCITYALALPNQSFSKWYAYLLNKKFLHSFYGQQCKEYDVFNFNEIKCFLSNLKVPEDAADIARRIAVVYSYDPREITRAGWPISEETAVYKQRIATIQDILKKVQDPHTDEETALRVALLYESQYERLLYNLRKFHTLPTYTFGIITNAKTAMSHALGYVAHKYNGTVEFLFLDSLNADFNGIRGWSRNYRRSLFRLYDYFSCPDLLEDMIIRYIYIRMQEKKDAKSVHTYIQELTNLNLLHNTLFKRVYKPSICRDFYDVLSHDDYLLLTC